LPPQAARILEQKKALLLEIQMSVTPLPMTDLDYQHKQFGLFDLVNNTIVAGSNTVDVIAELF